MTTLQINQLVYRKCNAARKDQKRVRSGSKSAEELWSGYAIGTYNIYE